MRTEPNYRLRIGQMSREEISDVLLQRGFDVPPENEATESLRLALWIAVDDGTIDLDCLQLS